MQLKIIPLTVAMVAVIAIARCQETENTKVYEIRNSITVYPCYITGKRIYADDRFSTPPLGAKFMLVRPLTTNSDTLIIRYLVWNKKKDSVLRKYYNDPLIVSEWNKKDTNKTTAGPGRWRNPGADTNTENSPV